MNKAKLCFMLVGVARSGTTSLHYYLRQHPDIGMSSIKEPKYLSSIDLELPQKGIGDHTVYAKIVKSEVEYDRLFEGLKSYRCIGESSSDCFYYHKDVIPRIKKKWGNVKIIVCLRNPIDRAFSAYNNLVRDSRETLSFLEALKLEETRIAQNWDWMWHYKHGSLYAEALRHFQNEFSHVKVVFSEDLEQNPQKVLSEIFSFLNVGDTSAIDVNTKYSPSGKPKNKIIAALTNRNNPIIFKLRELVLKLIPRKYLEKVSSKLFKKDSIDLNIRKELQNFFKEDIKNLESLTNKDLSSWQ